MASYRGKSETLERIGMCDGYKYSSFKDKRKRTGNSALNKKKSRFDNDSIFILFKESDVEGGDGLDSKEVGSDKEILKFDDSDNFDEHKDGQ